MIKLTEQLKEIKAQLHLSMDGAASQNMYEKGLIYKLNFSVELPRIKSIATACERDRALVQVLWKEDICECKILVGLFQPVDSSPLEVVNIWVESIQNIEIIRLTCMNLFQHLPYAPARSFHWVAVEEEYTQICGFLAITRLPMKKGDMNERTKNELLNQAVTAFLSGSYHVRSTALTTICHFMQRGEKNAFQVCRRVEEMKESSSKSEQLLYNLVREEVTG